MTDLNTIKQKLTLNKQRWNSMHEDIAAIQSAADKETRAEEKIRSKNILSEKETELAEIEVAIREFEQQLKQQSQTNELQLLRDELVTLRRKKSYQGALDTARQLQTLIPDDPQIASEVEELEQRILQGKQAQLTFAKLSAHITVLSPVIADLAQVLGRNSDHEYRDTVILVADQFLDGQLTADDFIVFCNKLFNTATSQPSASNNNTQQYLKVASSISSGRTVLFLGSGIPALYDNSDQKGDENHLASQLANEVGYPDFSGSLSSISEYYQLLPGFGRKNLLSSLHSSLSIDFSNLSFYESLSRIKVPLVIVSTAYDTLLERTFHTAGKPYVEIASIIIPGKGDYKLGNVMLRYFDKGQEGKCVEKLCSHEDLSHLDLLKDYSIIYKLRGSCGQSHLDGNIGWRNSLTLSESNYFTFAESASKIIPDYLSRQFLDREFLILGFTPEKWEDRLLARALLSKRQNFAEPCYTIGKASDPLQDVFWENQKVRQYEMEFSELDRHLQEATQ